MVAELPRNGLGMKERWFSVFPTHSLMSLPKAKVFSVLLLSTPNLPSMLFCCFAGTASGEQFLQALHELLAVTVVTPRATLCLLHLF